MTLAQKIEAELRAELGGPTVGSEATAKYVGARGHARRKADEQSQLVYWGHGAAALRAIGRKPRSGDEATLWKAWLEVFRATDVFEIRAIALAWLAAPARRKLRTKRARDVFALAADVDNWATSDALSAMVAEIVENDHAHSKTLKKWNRSKNPWLRRQSVVGIYNYARLRKNHLNAESALELIEPLLEDPHFYVQRGVGWALREVYRVDQIKQKKFVEKNLGKISATAW